MPLAINSWSLWKIILTNITAKKADCDLEEIEIEDKRQEFLYI